MSAGRPKLDCLVCVSQMLKNIQPSAFVLSTIDQCEQFGVGTIVRDLCPEHRRIHETLASETKPKEKSS